MNSKRKKALIIIIIVSVSIICALGIRQYNGYWFFFDMPDRSGWTGEGTDRKYLDAHGGIIKDELLEVDSETYYFDNSGSIFKGDIELDGFEYLFDEETATMHTGWIHKDSKRYYYDELGHKIIDMEYSIDGRDFLFDSVGTEFIGETTIDGKSYYFEPLRGKLKNGERQIDDKWYYYTEDGSRFGTGWVQIEEDRICYFDNEAGMLFGEQEIDGQQYLLNISTGGRMTGTVYFNGQIYTIAATGVIESKEKSKIWNGIDVSVHQEEIDWKAVKESGIQFAIVRAGYFEPVGQHAFIPDRTFVNNVIEAQKNGISVGAYIYLYSYTDEMIAEGLDDFNFMTKLNRIKLDLPVFLDVEDSDYFKPGSDELGGYDYRTDLVRSGMDYLIEMGYDAGFYTFHQWANKEFDVLKLFKEGYPFWIARWYDNNEELPTDTTSWDDNGVPGLWQYRATGQVPGIKKEVDMNYLYWESMKLKLS